MLSQFFRPKWQHSNIQIRKTAILKLEDEVLLTQIALNDSDASVRELAVQQLNTAEALLTLSKNAKNDNEKALASQRWVLMLTGGVESTNIKAESFILDCQDETLLYALMTYSQNESIRQLALSGLKNEEQLINLMAQNKNPKAWQWIVEKLETEQALKQALHIANGRDKKTQQLLKHKLEQKKQAELQQHNIQQHIEQLSEKLTHLLQTESNPLFEGILLNLQQQFDQLQTHCSTQDSANIKQLIEACQHQLTKKHIIAITPELAPKDTNDELANHLIKQLESLINDAYQTASNSNDIAQLLDENKILWADLSTHSHHAKKQYQSLCETLLALLNIKNSFINNETANTSVSHDSTKLQFALKTLSKLNAPKNNALAQHIQTLLSAIEEHTLANKKKNQAAQQHIYQLLEQAEEKLQQKHLKDTQSLLDKAKGSINNLPKNDAMQFNNTLQRIYNGIRALENWKNDVNDEKRKELIEQMRHLNTPTIDPEPKADAIKTLRTEWKALGHCHDQTLWNAFKELADIAYIPCHEHFEKLKALRLFNAQQKNDICQELEQLINTIEWNNADWRAIEKIYSSAQNEWKRFVPVDKESHQALQSRFFAAIKSIKDKLHEAKIANRDKMQSLITQANALAEDSDISIAINTYTQLQQQWKAIGISYRHEQQALWIDFKKAGDALYDKRQHVRIEAEETKQAHLQQANECISSILALSQLDDIVKHQATFEATKNTFKSLGSFPKEQYKPCQDKFHQACDNFEQAFSNAKQLEKTKKYTQLENMSEQLIAAETKLHNGDLFSTIDAPSTINTLFQNSELPEKWVLALTQRLEKNSIQTDAKIQALLICIEAEIAAEIEVPTEDATLKMQWQMQQLQKGFGQQIKMSASQKLDDLYLRWYTQVCWNKTEYQPLEKRFLMAGKKLQKLSTLSD